MFLAVLVFLAAVSPSEPVRITFDFDCAQVTAPRACSSVLPSTEEALEPGTWNDRAVLLDFDLDGRLEIVAPTKCGATGNCEWRILSAQNCAVLGQLEGEFITIVRAGASGWPAVEGYWSMGAGQGVLAKYAWKGDQYEETATSQLDDPAASEYIAAIGRIRCPGN
jgi:hypothetical protein